MESIKQGEDKKGVRSWRHNDGKGNVVCVRLYAGPTTEEGSLEYHAIVTASSLGRRRQPTMSEIREALTACKMPTHCDVRQGRDGVHAYSDSLVSSR